MRILSLVLLLGIASVPCFATPDRHPETFGGARSQSAQPVFDDINQGYFGGELRNVEVRWANLKAEKARGVTRFYDEGSVLIELDRGANQSLRNTRTTLSHEACHVATRPGVEHESSNEVHGAAFQECMQRFSGKGKEQGSRTVGVLMAGSEKGR
jgi:hypothetical protein